MTPIRFLVWLLVSAAGVPIGFGLALAAATLIAIFVPHCGIPCDDTAPEFVVATAAYGTWALTTAVTSILAWRTISQRPR